MPRVISTAVLPGNCDRVVVLVNPKSGASGGGPRGERLVRRLQEKGFRAELFTDLATATSLANQWHAEGLLRALVGSGGDGTAAELVNRTCEGMPITLLPAGNSNLLAGHFGLSRDPDVLCQTIADGLVAKIDAAAANGRIFLVVASCGFDAEVVHRVHSRRTGHISNFKYLKPIAESIGGYKFPEIHIQCDDRPQCPPHEAAARWLFVFNLPCYGGGFRIAPHADGADGLLDVCTFRRGDFLSGLKYAAAIVLRQHRRLSDWATRRVRRLRITANAPVPYQLDGDPGGMLPVDMEVLPGRLSLIVPTKMVDSRGGLGTRD